MAAVAGFCQGDQASCSLNYQCLKRCRLLAQWYQHKHQQHTSITIRDLERDRIGHHKQQNTTKRRGRGCRSGRHRLLTPHDATAAETAAGSSAAASASAATWGGGVIPCFCASGCSAVGCDCSSWT